MSSAERLIGLSTYHTYCAMGTIRELTLFYDRNDAPLSPEFRVARFDLAVARHPSHTPRLPINAKQETRDLKLLISKLMAYGKPVTPLV